MRTVALCTDDRSLCNGTGVSSYAAALADAQRVLDPKSSVLASSESKARWRRWAKTLRFWPLTTSPNGSGAFAGPDIFRQAQIDFDIRRRLSEIRLPGPPGIIHWSYPMPLRAAGWCNVYTIHDLIPLLQPDLTPISQHRHRRLLQKIVDVADLIVTVSESSRAEILTLFDIAPERLVNCGEAVRPGQSSAALPSGLRRGDYLLVLGSVEPRKNIGRIVAAYRQSGLDLPLVIAGPEGWRSHEAMAGAVDLPNVIRLPWLPDKVRVSLLANSRALLMPSLAEGFGLPVVEAMACGVPVLCSSTGALAETAGQAALLVDPHDQDALSAGIRRIASDPALRTALREAGLVNAGRFTAARFRAALAAAYSSLLPT